MTKSSIDLSRGDLIRMVGMLRGLAYSLKFDVEDRLSKEERFVDDEEFKSIIEKTTFNVDEIIGENNEF